jgi:hypothetical protein
MIDQISSKHILSFVVLDDAVSSLAQPEALPAGVMDIMGITLHAAAVEESPRRTVTRFPEILQDTGTPFTKVKLIPARESITMAMKSRQDISQ